MTPVAGGIADGQKDRLVLPLRLFKGLLAPGIPIHRIVGVLQEIWGFFTDQTVGFFHVLAPRVLIGISFHVTKTVSSFRGSCKVPLRRIISGGLNPAPQASRLSGGGVMADGPRSCGGRGIAPSARSRPPPDSGV